VGVTIDLKVDDALKDYVNDSAISPVLRGELIDWKMRSAAFRFIQKQVPSRQGMVRHPLTQHLCSNTAARPSHKAVTIYGGTNEVQSNIIAKRVLGLPD
jgi:hypothetical protein